MWAHQGIESANCTEEVGLASNADVGISTAISKGEKCYSTNATLEWTDARMCGANVIMVTRIDAEAMRSR